MYNTIYNLQNITNFKKIYIICHVLYNTFLYLVNYQQIGVYKMFVQY